jgi:dTDP-D-glucose 4,6-dehydratase
MRVLITGGAGLVGSNLALAARRAFPDAEVFCMDNLYRRDSLLNVPCLKQAGAQFHRGDVGDTDSLPSVPFDFLVECSAESPVLAGRDGAPDYLFQTNLAGTNHCLEKACARGMGNEQGTEGGRRGAPITAAAKRTPFSRRCRRPPFQPLISAFQCFSLFFLLSTFPISAFLK